MCNSKICGKCQTEKPLEEFNKNKTKKLGVAAICKKCHSEYRKNQYQKNKNKELTQVKEYQKNNLIGCGYSKKAGRTHLTNCSECGYEIYRSAKSIASNITFICNSCKTNPMKIFISYSLRNAKKRAISKGLEFNIDYEYIMELLEKTNYICAVTNILLEFDNNKKNINQMSLDRIDSTKGYIVGNIQLVTLGFNYMKNSFTQTEVVEFLKNIRI